MEQYTITGMSCAACSARVEKAVSALEGVESCAVNLLTNSMSVEGSAGEEEIIRAVEAAGYGASAKGGGEKKAAQEEALKDRDTPVLKRRLISSLGFLLLRLKKPNPIWIMAGSGALFTGISLLLDIYKAA